MTLPKNDQVYPVLLQLVVIIGILLIWEIAGFLG